MLVRLRRGWGGEFDLFIVWEELIVVEMIADLVLVVGRSSGRALEGGLRFLSLVDAGLDHLATSRYWM
jgi:hypothetical protein